MSPTSDNEVLESPGLGALRVRYAGFVTGPWDGSTKATFRTIGGRIIIVVSATAYVSGAGVAGVNYTVDGGNTGSPVMYFNLTSTHMTLPTHFQALLLAANTAHTIALSNNVATSDSGDRAGILVVELPQ